MSYLPDPERYAGTAYRRCGRSGLLLPPVSLGLWHNFGAESDYENARRLVHSAFDSGITYLTWRIITGHRPVTRKSASGAFSCRICPVTATNW